MKTRIVLAALLTAGAWGTAQTISYLEPDKLVGTWEAVALHRGVPALCVYQMAFSSPGDARFVAMRPNMLMFVGKLTSSKVKDGRITLQFSAEGEQGDYRYARVKVEGSGRSVSDGTADIDGKITVYDWGSTSSSQAVLFRNKLWVQDFPEVSKAAQQVLHDGKSHP